MITISSAPLIGLIVNATPAVTAGTMILLVLMPLVGTFADRTGRKRDIMLGCGAAGAIACVAVPKVGDKKPCSGSFDLTNPYCKLLPKGAKRVRIPVQRI